MKKCLMIKRFGVIGIIIIFITAGVIPTITSSFDNISVSSFYCNSRDINEIHLQSCITSPSSDDSNIAPGAIIIGYLPPYIPKDPNPKDSAINIPINADLRWTGGDPDIGDNVTYDVYFGDTLPLQKVASNISVPSYDLEILTEYTMYMWSIVAWDTQGLSSLSPTWCFTTSNTTNNPPFKPNQPSGETNGIKEYEYIYSTITFDPDGDQILYYFWDWGDGNDSGWLGPYSSMVRCEAKHSWTIKGNYSIKVKAKDLYDFESNWSDPLPITMPFVHKNSIRQFFDLLIQRFPNGLRLVRYIISF